MSKKKKFSEQLQEPLVVNSLANIIAPDISNPYTGSTPITQVDAFWNNNRWYLISNMRQVLSEIYVEHGIIKNAIDVPVDDAFRGGVKIQTSQLDAEQISDLEIFMERENDFGIANEAIKWNRLFGGAGILILVDDQDPEDELDISAIDLNTKVEFRAVDMWELYYSRQNTGDYGLDLKEPVSPDLDYYNYYGHNIHKSRVMILKGRPAPSFVRPRLRGWGLSEVEHIVNGINQYLKANNLTYEVLDEFKLDIFKIKGLTAALLNPNGTQKIRDRVSLSNYQKNYQNALTMDAEDDYVQKQLSFAGLAEAQEGIRMQVASDLRMPLTKLFGVSSAGFNSGEDDIENYNSMVESEVRKKIKHHLVRLVEIRCQQIYGFVPDDVKIEFESLRIMSTTQEEEVKTSKFNRLIQARQAGFLDAKTFADICNKENIFGSEIKPHEELPLQQEGIETKEFKAPKSKTVAKEAKS